MYLKNHLHIYLEIPEVINTLNRALNSPLKYLYLQKRRVDLDKGYFLLMNMARNKFIYLLWVIRGP